MRQLSEIAVTQDKIGPSVTPLMSLFIASSKILGFALISALASMSLFAVPAAQANETLGIGVSISPEQNGDLSMGDRAWFAIEPGESATREIRISSQSDIDQVVSFQVLDLDVVNGELVPNTAEVSKTAKWLSFEPSFMVIPARGTATLRMTYDIPLDAPEEASNAVLRVLASAASEDTVASGGIASVGTATGVDLEVWLGVGSAISLLPSFDISSISPLILSTGRVLRVEFENLGIIPLSLRGSVQFSDPAFVERSFEPSPFVSRVIPSGETGYVDIPVTEEITDGNWQVFVRASMQQVTQTRLFEQNLVFAAPSSFSVWALVQMILIVSFAILAVIGLRMVLRPSGSTSQARFSGLWKRLVSRVSEFIESFRSRPQKPPRAQAPTKTKGPSGPPRPVSSPPSAVEASLARIRAREAGEEVQALSSTPDAVPTKLTKPRREIFRKREVVQSPTVAQHPSQPVSVPDSVPVSVPDPISVTEPEPNTGMVVDEVTLNLAIKKALLEVLSSGDLGGAVAKPEEKVAAKKAARTTPTAKSAPIAKTAPKARAPRKPSPAGPKPKATKTLSAEPPATTKAKKD